jgi:hypothetical protein
MVPVPGTKTSQTLSPLQCEQLEVHVQIDATVGLAGRVVQQHSCNILSPSSTIVLGESSWRTLDSAVCGALIGSLVGEFVTGRPLRSPHNDRL